MIPEEDVLDLEESDLYNWNENNFFYEEELDDDELHLEEEAFMQGYLAA